MVMAIPGENSHGQRKDFSPFFGGVGRARARGHLASSFYVLVPGQKDFLSEFLLGSAITIPVTSGTTQLDRLTDADRQQLADRIGPAAFSDRAGRQFPYQPTTPDERTAVHADVDRILHDINGIVVQLVGRFFNGALQQTREEIQQDIRVHIWDHVLSRFDATRGVKLNTFLYWCIANRCRSTLRSMARRSRSSRRLAIDHAVPVTGIAGHDVDIAEARRVEALADKIMRNPDRYLSCRQARALKHLMQSDPSKPLHTIARELGYANPCSFSMMLNRIRARLCEIAGEELDDAVEEKPNEPKITQRTAGTPSRTRGDCPPAAAA